MCLKTKLPKQKCSFLIKLKSEKKEEQTGFEEKYLALFGQKLPEKAQLLTSNESNSLENNHFVDILYIILMLAIATTRNN